MKIATYWALMILVFANSSIFAVPSIGSRSPSDDSDGDRGSNETFRFTVTDCGGYSNLIWGLNFLPRPPISAGSITWPSSSCSVGQLRTTGSQELEGGVGRYTWCVMWKVTGDWQYAGGDNSSWDYWVCGEQITSLQSPPDEDEFEPGESITFRWYAVSNAGYDVSFSYKIQIDNSSSFSSPEFDSPRGSATSCSWTPPSAGTWYWRVGVYVDFASGSPCSHGGWYPCPYRTFTVGSISPCEPVELDEPTDLSTICDNTPLFDWNAPTSCGLIRYRLLVDNNSSFSSPEIDVYRTSSSYTPSSALPNNRYYWKVGAENSAGWSWSEVYEFEVVNPFITVTTPPTLTVGASYDIRWNYCEIPANIKIEYSTNGGSSWLVIDPNDPNDGRYTWNPIPNTPSTNCKIRISDAADGTPSGISGTFTISITPEECWEGDHFTIVEEHCDAGEDLRCEFLDALDNGYDFLGCSWSGRKNVWIEERTYGVEPILGSAGFELQFTYLPSVPVGGIDVNERNWIWNVSGHELTHWRTGFSNEGLADWGGYGTSGVIWATGLERIGEFEDALDDPILYALFMSGDYNPSHNGTVAEGAYDWRRGATLEFWIYILGGRMPVAGRNGLVSSPSSTRFSTFMSGAGGTVDEYEKLENATELLIGEDYNDILTTWKAFYIRSSDSYGIINSEMSGGYLWSEDGIEVDDESYDLYLADEIHPTFTILSPVERDLTFSYYYLPVPYGSSSYTPSYLGSESFHVTPHVVTELNSSIELSETDIYLGYIYYKINGEGDFLLLSGNKLVLAKDPDTYEFYVTHCPHGNLESSSLEATGVVLDIGESYSTFIKMDVIHTLPKAIPWLDIVFSYISIYADACGMGEDVIWIETHDLVDDPIEYSRRFARIQLAKLEVLLDIIASGCFTTLAIVIADDATGLGLIDDGTAPWLGMCIVAAGGGGAFISIASTLEDLLHHSRPRSWESIREEQISIWQQTLGVGSFDNVVAMGIFDWGSTSRYLGERSSTSEFSGVRPFSSIVGFLDADTSFIWINDTTRGIATVNIHDDDVWIIGFYDSIEINFVDIEVDSVFAVFGFSDSVGQGSFIEKTSLTPSRIVVSMNDTINVIARVENYTPSDSLWWIICEDYERLVWPTHGSVYPVPSPPAMPGDPPEPYIICGADTSRHMGFPNDTVAYYCWDGVDSAVTVEILSATPDTLFVGNYPVIPGKKLILKTELPIALRWSGPFAYGEELKIEDVKRPGQILLWVYPNPFNSSVSIKSPVNAIIEIYDIDGRYICGLQGGSQVWRPEASIGSGIYLVRATVGEQSITKRVVYLK